MEHIGFLPPAEDMFVVQRNHFFFYFICFIHFGCPIQSSGTNKLWGKVCFTRLVYSVKWKKIKWGERHPAGVMVSIHFDSHFYSFASAHVTFKRLLKRFNGKLFETYSTVLLNFCAKKIGPFPQKS